MPHRLSHRRPAGCSSFSRRLAHSLLLLTLLVTGAIPAWADVAIGGCTIRVPTPPATECPGANLSSADLSNLDLTAANLSNANLLYAFLYAANLTNANFSGANLTRANLYSTNLDGINLSNATLTMVQSGNTIGIPASLPAGWRFEGGHLIGPAADLTYAGTLQGLDLSGMNLAGITAEGANFSFSNLAYTNLTDAYLGNANLYQTDLSNANLSNANLAGAELGGVIWNHTTCPDGSNSDYHLDGSCLTALDYDRDGDPDSTDTDDDNDGVPDTTDYAPLDAGIFCAPDHFWNGSSCAVLTLCGVGQYEAAAPSPVSDRVCATCSNGGASYSCSEGSYRSGMACPGILPFDTQTCSAHTPVDHCATYSPDSDACAACEAGYTLNGSVCEVAEVVLPLNGNYKGSVIKDRVLMP